MGLAAEILISWQSQSENSEEEIQNALSIPTRFFQKWTEINGGLQMILQTKEKFRLSKKHHSGA